jgi:4,5-DOPA dioxygenase extradiol
MNLIEFEKSNGSLKNTDLMPSLFVGHGNPMNAIEQNEFTAGWQSMGQSLEKPRAILCISAHWETGGTMVTGMSQPRTIHDFYGFPEQLFRVEYPAPGDIQVAFEIRDEAIPAKVGLDQTWGLDHGCWSVVKHMFPDAKTPILQLSLDYTLSPAAHYDLAKQLAGLRRKGILVIGSGNIIHNLRLINWHNPDSGHDWAMTANEKLKNIILNGKHKDLIDYQFLGHEIQLSVPTPEHFLPLLYVLAMQEKDEPVAFFNDKLVYGSLSMTSIKIN